MKHQISCPFQTPFYVESEDATVLSHLKMKYGYYCTPGYQDTDPCFSVAKADGEFYEISWQGETFRDPSPLGFIAHKVARMRIFDPRVFALHGAAVEYKGKAYVFLAATTAGKTTLTAYLTQKGFGYITDDCVLVDRETLEVYPCTTPIHLREGGRKVLQAYGSLPPVEHLDDMGFERWTFLPENCVQEPLPLGKVFFLKRTKDENGLISLETNEVFSRLLKAPITDYALTEDHLKMISRLAKTRPVELYYYDMNYVSEVLNHGNE